MAWPNRYLSHNTKNKNRGIESNPNDKKTNSEARLGMIPSRRSGGPEEEA